MKFLLIIIILLFQTLVSNSQKKTVITYVLQVKFAETTVDSLLNDMNGNSDEYIMDEPRDTFMKKMNALFNLFQMNDTILVWRQGAEVVMTQPNIPDKVYKYYNINTLEFRVIDSFTYRHLNKVDTFQYSMNYKSNPDWKVSYKITKTGTKKRLLGFTCRHFMVEELKLIKGDDPATRVFSIWATKKIKPSFSTHAVLSLYDRVLSKYTPLEMEQRFLRAPNSFQIFKAIHIR